MGDQSRRRGVLAAFVVALAFLAPGAAAQGDRGLVDAVRTQDAAHVQELLSRRADVNAASDDGSTPLLWAAHWNDVRGGRARCFAPAPTRTPPTNSA